MSASQPSIFEVIFNQSLAPSFILKANAPEFTVLAQNREHQLALHTPKVNMAGKSAYKLLVTDENDADLQSSYIELTQALTRSIEEKVIIKLPAIKSLVVDPDGLHTHSVWQQMEVVPVIGVKDDVEYLICTVNDISRQVWLEAARRDGLTKEIDLTEELAASNEELSATNEELSASIEELRQSQENLAESNLELENRVEQRTHALAESENRFRAMVEQSPVPMLVTMGEAMIFDIINQPMLDLIGKDASVIGMPWHEALPELDGQDIIRQLLDTYDSGVSWEGREVPIVIRKNGVPEMGFYNISYKPLTQDGKSIGMLQSAIDVTSLVKSRLQVEKLSEEQHAANEELAAMNEELQTTNDELNHIQENLENMVVELAESEQQLQQIINILPAAVVVICGNGLVAELINDTCLGYWNKTREQVVGKPLLEILPELSDQVFPDQLRQVMKTGETIEVKESRVLLKDSYGIDRETFVDYTYQPLTDSSGGYSRVLVMSSENTERVLSRKVLEQFSEEMQSMNEELKASNEELAAVNQQLHDAQKSVEEGRIALRLAIDAAEFGTWFIHSVTREFVTDARLKELFGYYPNESLSIEQALAQITDEYRDVVATALENAIYHHGDYDMTYPVIGFHDQQLRWLRAIGNLQVDPSGAFSAFTGVVMDITVQVLAAEKVKNAEETLRMAIASGELATWRLDANLGKISASPRFNELFGFSPDEEVPYTTAIGQISPEYQQLVEDAVNASFENGANFKVEYPVTGFHDNKLRWIRSVGKFVADEKDGNYITGVMADITEQKTDELRKNSFIAMVSHELKTPLTSLNGYLQVVQLKAKKAEDTFISGALEQSVKQVKRMTSMINGFLNVSRLESGKIHIEKKRFDMADLIREMSEETKTLYASHEFVFHPVEPTLVNADHDKIGQVINNFISNAVKYSTPGTKIQIACIQHEGFTRVSVSDEGMGIDQAELSRLFERYYRVNNENNQISGFGIGLYLSAEIIERHQGKIWAESELGKGSKFYFSLPLLLDL